MKIFYFFQEYDTPMFKWQRTHFIDEMIRHGIHFNTFNPLLFENAEVANKSAVDKLRGGDFDLFMTNCCYHKMLFPETLLEIRKMGIPTLSLRCDNLVIPFEDRVLAPLFDLIWLTAKETQHLYNKWGAKTVFAPYAANPYTFSYIKSEVLKRVSFIGRPYGSRSLMINTLTGAGVPLDLYCGGLSTHISNNDSFKVKYDAIHPGRVEVLISRMRFREGRKVMLGALVNKLKKGTTVNENQFLTKLPGVDPAEISSYYSKYALSLASTSTSHTDSLPSPLKIVNLRNFEIPMSGGIEICKYNPELAEYFEEGKEILFYRSDEELVEKAKHYTHTASESEIFAIKNAARKRAESEHSWKNRFLLVFNTMGLKL